MKYKFQMIYKSEPNNSSLVAEIFRIEAEVMKKMDINTSTTPDEDATNLMFRGVGIRPENYPTDLRFINTYEHYIKYLNLSSYFPLIEDLSIETFFTNNLDQNERAEIKKRGWKKVFVKKERSALEHIDEGKSLWPTTSFDEMKKLYDEMQIDGKYAIRKFIEKDIIDKEERYWVFNGNIYHRHNKIPNVVKEAAKRLNTMGSKYYTIDATPDFVVEVNPGESSDRHAVNSAELFASWIKKEFVDR